MHEFSIVESLISTVVNECRNAGFNKIEKIRILIGKASGVMPEALLFAFDILKEDTITKDATLIIEEALLTGRCNNCDRIFTTEEAFIFSCPNCHHSTFEIIAGQELNIIDIEVA